MSRLTRRGLPWPLLLLVIALALPSAGCERLIANAFAASLTRGGGTVTAHFDYDMIGDALPYSLVQMEGLLAVVPDNEELGITMMRAYLSYSYGWVEEEVEVAQERGDFDAELAAQGRARLLYTRARNIGQHFARLRHEGFDEAMQGGAEQFEAYLREHYTNPEHDTPLLFWLGYAWGSAISQGRDDPAMVLDLPFARACVERAVALDESFFDYSGLTFLAVAYGSLPESLGGNPERSRTYFERALEATHHRFFAVQLNYARIYAAGQGDRDLYIRLLREVVGGVEPAEGVEANEEGLSTDPEPAARLPNRIARRRALRALRRIDEFF